MIQNHEIENPGILEQMPLIASPDDRILVTGAAGYIGSRVVKKLIERGFRQIVCFARPSARLYRIEELRKSLRDGGTIETIEGNLLRPEDCDVACKGVSIIYHLAAGKGDKSFPDSFMNSVVATRNLIESALKLGRLKRFVLVSSFSVYTNCDKPRGRLLDETCPIESRPELRGDAYCYSKVKQEELVREYSRTRGVPYTILRPGSVYGEGSGEIVGRVGIGTFGLFLHIGGSNTIPFTYVENCADAIVMAGLVKGVDGEVFNVVDDELPSSRQFLRKYKKNVNRFRSIYVPHIVSYALCYAWEKYSEWSYRQLPPAFNRGRWHAYWKKTRYSNTKLKQRLGWSPGVTMSEGMNRYFQSLKTSQDHA